jgi:hypothetical protein
LQAGKLQAHRLGGRLVLEKQRAVSDFDGGDAIAPGGFWGRDGFRSRRSRLVGRRCIRCAALRANPTRIRPLLTFGEGGCVYRTAPEI